MAGRDATSRRKRGSWCEQANTSLYNAELSDLSMLFILQQVAATAGIPASASETMRVAGGNATLPQAIAAELGAAMVADAPVTAVRRRDDLVFVTARGEEYFGAHVVIAAPPPTLRAVRFDPPLPARDRGRDRRARPRRRDEGREPVPHAVLARRRASRGTA